MPIINAITSPAPAIITTVDNSGNLVFQNAGTTNMTLDTNQNAIHTGYISAPNTFGFKNKIINGNMMISQRNGTSATSQVNGAYNLDRFGGFSSAGGAVTGRYTVTQSTSAPTGFTNSALITASTTSTPASTDAFAFWQIIEGYNIADLGWGTSWGKPVTLSFWVQSSLTGTFGGNIRNQNGNYSFPFTYTISSANTWSQIVITMPAPPSGSTWQTDNSQGIYVFFGLQVGSGSTLTATGAWQNAGGYGASGCVNLLATSGATWYITGVQFEAGKVATPFDWRPYGTELQLCQRYFETNYGVGYAIGSASSYANNMGVFFQGFNTTNGQKHVYDWFKVPKRAVPTATYYDAAGNAGKMSSLDVGGTATNNVSIGYTPLNQNNLASGATATWYGAQFFWTASAEL